ncbi:uncharacterized protein KGF55_004944 [Candida pseudojiufengensis]|uniref:uncharacterized protein n=1 Tax=Candida pseudojiufengensis TaxID=497109 RepID=UPI002224ABD2|nr:uncharacterized protein KGF55_004944 [Candida pseudojiufengensis]KAI5959712.1 hypothetical protein KGF55_004944 [Candida pseudojiufengensis]
MTNYKPLNQSIDDDKNKHSTENLIDTTTDNTNINNPSSNPWKFPISISFTSEPSESNKERSESNGIEQETFGSDKLNQESSKQVKSNHETSKSKKFPISISFTSEPKKKNEEISEPDEIKQESNQESMEQEKPNHETSESDIPHEETSESDKLNQETSTKNLDDLETQREQPQLPLTGSKAGKIVFSLVSGSIIFFSSIMMISFGENKLVKCFGIFGFNISMYLLFIAGCIIFELNKIHGERQFSDVLGAALIATILFSIGIIWLVLKYL